jgi:hypothetical protein
LGTNSPVRDERIPAFFTQVVLGALALYWIVFGIRCGEDECIDRAAVAGITAAVWLAAAAVVAGVRGRSGPRMLIRWAAATLWLVAAWAVLVVLTFVAFDVVYD